MTYSITSSSRCVRFTFGASLLALSLCGCPSGDDGRTSNNPMGGGLTTAGTFAQPTAGVGNQPTAGTGIGTAGVGNDVGDGGTQNMPGRPSIGSTAMPCDVNDILKTSCQSCHAQTPISGVPMALLTWEDTQQPSVSNPALTVHDMMKMRIHDAVKPMPPPPSMLTAEKLATLDAWLDGGTPKGDDPSCKPEIEIPPTMPPADAENCYEIRAHANSLPGDTTPLTVDGEHYAWFYFDAPWPDNAQGVYFETLPGDHPEIIHHWLIYAEDNPTPPFGCASPQPNGTVVYPVPNGNHCSTPTLVAGWAPGANNNALPNDVGMKLAGANKKMSMEIHFFNNSGGALTTNAGVKICTVEKNLRPNTATISWLGTEGGINIGPMEQDATAKGTCTPQFQGDIHVIRSWPHMHLMGTAMESTIIRKDGKREPVSPQGGWPFDFNNEVSWKTEFVIHAGDKIETVCHYTNTTNNRIQVGFENEFEMCFNFTLAYPASALVNKNFTGSSSLTGSSTACLQ